MDALTPVSRAEQALAEATTPKETKEVEAMAAAAKAWAKEQNDFELAAEASWIYIQARCKTTELVEPTIRSSEQGRPNKGNDVVTLVDYGFTKMQWNRRKQELRAYLEDIGAYQDDCIEKQVLPSPFGLVGYWHRIEKEANEERVREWMAKVVFDKEEIEAKKDGGAPALIAAIISGYWTDAASGDRNARAFLESDECKEWCIEIRKDYYIIKNWIEAGYTTTPIHIMLYQQFENSSIEPAKRASAAVVSEHDFRDNLIGGKDDPYNEGFRIIDEEDDPMEDTDDIVQNKAIAEWLNE